jgi:hypothetical protein
MLSALSASVLSDDISYGLRLLEEVVDAYPYHVGAHSRITVYDRALTIWLPIFLRTRGYRG